MQLTPKEFNKFLNQAYRHGQRSITGNNKLEEKDKKIIELTTTKEKLEDRIRFLESLPDKSRNIDKVMHI